MSFKTASAVALTACAMALLLTASPAQAAFGFLPGTEGLEVNATEANGSAAEVAGAHPYTISTRIDFNFEGGGPHSDGDVRDLRISLPSGMVENPTAVGACSAAQFSTPRDSPFQESASGESCPLRTQVGIVTIRGAFPGGARTFGLFNLVPPPGYLAMIGANPFGAPITFSSQVRSSDGRFGLGLEARSVSQQIDISGLTVTVWGNPWLVGHDSQRGDCLNEANPAAGFGEVGTLEPEPQTQPPAGYVAGTCSTGNPRAFPPFAYLTLPTSCEPPVTMVTASSWTSPAPVSTSFQAPALKGCESRFQSTQGAAQPLTERASSPSGLDFNLNLNQENLTKNVTETGRLIPAVIAPSQIKKAVVTLPDGMTVNPSVAAGLGVCTSDQYAAETVSPPLGAGCPDGSKIGEIEINTPLSRKTIEGGLFLAQPNRNPFNSLLALYMVARDADRDLLIKLAGAVTVDPSSGRLAATFDQLPQLPYSHLNVHFRESQRAPLATPAACGRYDTETDLTPWLDPTMVLHGVTTFTLKSGIGGGACPTAAPFAPRVAGGTYNRNSGSYSPFYLHLTRSDADQEITSYSAQLPPGLLGKLAGVPFCPESAILSAARSGGFAETAHPSCPEASRIGHTTAGYGLGDALAYAPGNLYLAGPYHGSPLSVVAVDSATVGPFDLGVIVVRSAIRIDSQTARVSIDSAGSDPIPHIIKGIPLHLRDIRVFIDRPGFMVNPTSCERFGITSTLTGSGAAFSNPADDTVARVVDPFQVSFCSSLAFRPKIDLRLKGGSRRGRYPSLKATVTPRPGQANIGKASVILPPSLFLEQRHIGTLCSHAQSVAGRCPAASIYGRARAITPLLDEPLEGPVYLRVSGHKLPDLVAALSGRGVRIDVVGRIDSKRGGIRATYDVLPDAPLTKFVLNLNGGEHALLVNSDDICRSQPATAGVIGQNNQGIVLKPELVNPACMKKGKKRARRHAGGQRS